MAKEIQITTSPQITNVSVESSANITVNVQQPIKLANVVIESSPQINVSISRIAIGNIFNNVANANYSNFAGTANIANIAYSVSLSNVVGIGNIASINLDGNVSNILRGDGTWAPEDESLNANYANYAGNAFAVDGANVNGQVANALIAETVTSNAQPNITSVGILTSLSVTGNITANNIIGNIQGVASANYANYAGNAFAVDGANVNGSVATANYANFSGTTFNVSGANVSGEVATANYASYSGNAFAVDGANVNGNVATANYANYAGNAFNVSGSNVSGEVATANYASYSGNAFAVDGANVNGSVATANYANFAGTAFAVDGSNVNGSVATANYANYAGIAFSVDGANVNGSVATANYANYAGIAFSVDGANVNGSVATANYANFAGTAFSVSGSNVSGNVATANYANFAGTAFAVDGSNVNGSVATANYANYAGNAFNVSGSNVSGEVATANYASYSGNAFSVDGANVNGSVATANYANYAGNAFAVDGSNVNGNVATANYANYAGNAFSVDGSNVNGQVANALIAGTVYTGNQPNITSVGTLTSLSVSGNANVGNIGATNGVFTNVSGNGAALSSITGANVTGIVANANYATFTGSSISSNVANTVSDNAQPNITSVGTLTNLSVSGNINLGNGLNSVDYINFDTANVGPGAIAQMTWNGGEGTLDLGLKGGNVTLNVGTQEYARCYNDEATTLNKGEVVYINGAQGNRVSVKRAQANTEATSFGTIGLVAETIAAGGEGYIIVSGALYKLNTNGLTAGQAIYLSPTVAGGYTTTKPVAPNQLVVLGWIERVDTNVGSIYVKVDNGYELDELHDVLITSPVAGQALVYTSANLWENGNAQYSNTAGTVTTNAQPNITSVGILSSLSVSGNANVGNIGATNGVFTNVSGNGAALTNITGANITGQVANALVAGTVYTNAQPNITSVGTLTSLSVSGNIIAGNINATLITGTLTTGSQPNITSVGTLTTISVSGNANVGNIGATNGVFTNISGNGALLTNLNASNLTTGTVLSGRISGNYAGITGVGTLVVGSIGSTFGNINIGSNVFTGNGSGLTSIPAGNISGQVANALVAGTVYTASQPNITSVGTLTSLSVSGNANVGNIGATNGVFTNISGNGSALTNITGANVTGQVSSALTANTVTDNAQPNITSVGTLTTLSVSGNANVGNIGATNGVFTNISGNGALLTALNGSNITTGTVAIARLPALANTTDTTQGRLIKSGDWGFATTAFASGNLTDTRYNYSQIFRILSSEATGPGVTGGGIALPVDGTPATSYLVAATDGRLFTGHKAGSSATPTWREILPASTTGNATIGNISVTGTATLGNVSTAGFISATGNVNTGNIFANGFISVGTTGVGSYANINILRAQSYNSDPNQGLAYGTTTDTSVDNGRSYAWRTRATGNASAGISSVTESITRGGSWTERMRIASDGTLSIVGNANIGNLNLSGNIVDSGALTIQTSANGNITFTPNGTGIVNSTSPLAISGEYVVSQPTYRNRIINGDMRIDQRNTGSNVNITNSSATYVIDRFWAQSSATGTSHRCSQSTTAPTGFNNSFITTIITANASPAAGSYFTTARQSIEGLNISDLSWGTASAQPITVSFWVRSSATGTYPFFVQNGNTTVRSYVTSYTISAANTWEFKNITIAGDTSGNWHSNTTTGINIGFDLGSGSTWHASAANTWATGTFLTTASLGRLVATANANLLITGLQLEKGNVATPFERLTYDQQLIRCKRYFQVYSDPPLRGVFSATQLDRAGMVLPVEMRAAPTTVDFTLVATYDGVNTGNADSISQSYATSQSIEYDFVYTQTPPTIVAGRAGLCYNNNNSRNIKLNAEIN